MRRRVSAVTGRVATAAVLSWVAASGPHPGHAQQVTFSSKVEAVRVDVLVSDRGQPVTGLSPVDFEVLDNGVPQQVDLVSFEKLPLRVVLAARGDTATLCGEARVVYTGEIEI